MKKKKDWADKSWRQTDAGFAEYKRVRAEAQACCNADGFDRGIEANDLYKTWRHFMLPQKHNRYGHEVWCEVVMCEDLGRCRAGHGPEARRERRIGRESWASTVGDSATDMPADEFEKWFIERHGHAPGR